MKIEFDINAEETIEKMLDAGGLTVDTLVEYLISDPHWVKNNISELSKQRIKELVSDL